MSGHTIDPGRAALITKRIGQAFAFARDVVDAPRLLEEIPEGSTLLFRDATFQGELIRLTAHPSPDHPGWWTARVTGPAHFATRGERSSPPTFPESGPTAKDALDALEERLREAELPQPSTRRASGA